MRKLIAIAVMMVVFGGTAALGAVVWPAQCSGFNCVNTHLNDLNKQVGRAFTKTVVVSRAYSFDLSDPTNVPFIETVTPCGTPDPSDAGPYRGVAISGGIAIGGENAEQWHIVSSGPPNLMNSWPVFAANPTYVEGDPLPTVTTYAICAS